RCVWLSSHTGRTLPRGQLGQTARRIRPADWGGICIPASKALAILNRHARYRFQQSKRAPPQGNRGLAPPRGLSAQVDLIPIFQEIGAVSRPRERFERILVGATSPPRQ